MSCNVSICIFSISLWKKLKMLFIFRSKGLFPYQKIIVSRDFFNKINEKSILSIQSLINFFLTNLIIMENVFNSNMTFCFYLFSLQMTTNDIQEGGKVLGIKISTVWYLLHFIMKLNIRTNQLLTLFVCLKWIIIH